MKKKIYGALVLGSLILSTGGMVSCSDYDDDINNLNQRVDAVEKSLQDLEAAINSGKVITDVATTDEGVVFTLSDGSKYTAKHGNNGTNGTPGSVVTIGEDGYWYIDGVKQDYKAQGEKGDTGAAGKPGAEGKPGQDGKDGIYYVPNADGYWHKITPGKDGEADKDEPTKQKWTPEVEGTVRVVYNTENGELLIYGAEGMPEGEAYTIKMFSELKSLAIVPEVLDADTKLPAIPFYNIMKNGKVIVSTDANVEYRLNPANADVTKMEWSILDRTVQLARANGDNFGNFTVKVQPAKDGVLPVTLQSKKSLADLKQNEAAIIALQGQHSVNGETFVSDYAAVNITDLSKFTILNDHKSHAGKASELYEATTAPALTVDADTTMIYTGTCDLKTLVLTQATDITTKVSALDSEADHNVGLLKVEGLTYEFSKPETYIGADGQTNQQAYVDITKDGVVSVTKGTSAINRTPIFEVNALVKGEVVAHAYIKVQITEKEAAEDLPDETLTVACGTLDYQNLVDGNIVASLPWQRVNDEIYDEYGLSDETFRANYTTTAADINAEAGITLDADSWMNSTSGTISQVATIAIDPVKVKVLGQEGKERTATVTYKSNDRKVYPNIVVKFTYAIVDNFAFPTLNEDYLVAPNTIQTKGKMESGQWQLISGMAEHCTDYLANYQLPKKNHKVLRAELTQTVPAQTGAAITGIDYWDQEIALTDELTSDHKDFSVDMNLVLANNEVRVFTYTVRFASPYTAAINDLTLKTLPAEASKADLANAIVIYGPKNEIVYKNKAVTSEGKTYSLDKANMTLTYGIDGSASDSWASFGNNLTLDGQGMINWYNDGNVLVKDKYATSKVTVTVPNVVIIRQTGKITVLSSENSK